MHLLNLRSERIKAARPNLTVLEEYKKVKRKFMERLEEYNDVYARRDAKKAEFDDLRKRRLTEFATGFNQISLKLKEMYQVRALRAYAYNVAHLAYS